MFAVHVSSNKDSHNIKEVPDEQALRFIFDVILTDE